MLSDDQKYRINNVLSFIHHDIAADLTIERLASEAAYSTFYFQRLFKEITGLPPHQYLRKIRLEAAANQLLFSPYMSVREICESCGFQSLPSFTHAFKSTYKTTPAMWRSNKRQQNSESPPFLNDPEIAAAYQRLNPLSLPDPDIVFLNAQPVAYLRHTGYGRSISKTWQELTAWAQHEKRSLDIQIGLHHSNPEFIPLDRCHYVACLGIDEPITRRRRINSTTIPEGLHAAFHIHGQYGELLPYVSKIQNEWLPQSGYRAQTTPAFAKYQRNQFLNTDDHFDLVYYLPIAPL